MITKSNRSEWTKYDYLVIIKRFFRWMNKGKDPECTEWIISRVKKDYKLPEEMLTEAEIKQMIEAAVHSRNKALIATFWDAGRRTGEALLVDLGYEGGLHSVSEAGIQEVHGLHVKICVHVAFCKFGEDVSRVSRSGILRPSSSRSSLKMEKFSYFSVFGLNLESWAHLTREPSSFFFSEIDIEMPGRRIRSPTCLILYSLKFDIQC